jgi:hypothetical protein
MALTTPDTLNIGDSNTQIGKDGSNNLTLKDAVSGTKTLAQLAGGGGGGGDSWGDPVDADIVPDGAHTRDAGSTSYPFAEVHSGRVLGARTANGATVSAAMDGASVFGYANGVTGNGLQALEKGSLAIGYAVGTKYLPGYDTAEAYMQAAKKGAMAIGFAKADAQGYYYGGSYHPSYANAEVKATEEGSFAGGYCRSHAPYSYTGSNTNTGRVQATNEGAFSWGWVSSYNTSNYDGSTAYLTSSGHGSVAMGHASLAGSPGGTVGIRSTGSGSIALGFAGANASPYGYLGSVLQATGSGAMAMGAARGSAGSHDITAGGIGSFAGGWVEGVEYGPSNIQASGGGAFAFGYAGEYGSIRASAQGAMATGHAGVRYQCYIGATAKGSRAFGYAGFGGNIRAIDLGAFAGGYAAYYGTIKANGYGALAMGAADSYNIYAIGHGNIAFGSNYGVASPADIQATGAYNCFQFGTGTNALANSFQIGNAGLRFKGTSGAPGTPQNGDIWVANGYVYIRSNGTTCKCVNASM